MYTYTYVQLFESLARNVCVEIRQLECPSKFKQSTVPYMVLMMCPSKSGQAKYNLVLFEFVSCFSTLQTTSFLFL